MSLPPNGSPSPAPRFDPRTALVLCGGGLTGAFYEIGALHALAEADSPFAVDRVGLLVGTSAGAFVAGTLAAGMALDRLRAAVLGEAGAIGLRRHDFYHLEPGRAASLFLRALGVGTAYLKRIARRGDGDRGTFEDLANSPESLPSGLFRTDRYERFVQTVFAQERLAMRFAAVPRALFVTACDLDTGERVVFGPGTPAASIPRAIVASGAIPMFFEPFPMDGRLLIDGESTEVAHVDLALGAGAQRVLVINPKVPVRNDRPLSPPGRPPSADRIDRRGFFAVLDQSHRLSARVRLHREIEYARSAYPGAEVLLHQPEESDAMQFLYNPMTFSAKERVFRFGYESTRALLKDGRFETRAASPRLSSS